MLSGSLFTDPAHQSRYKAPDWMLQGFLRTHIQRHSRGPSFYPNIAIFALPQSPGTESPSILDLRKPSKNPPKHMPLCSALWNVVACNESCASCSPVGRTVGGALA